LVLRTSGGVIGTVGFVPCQDAFEQVPELCGGQTMSGFTTPEFGLYWAIDRAYQRQGYATEAAQAMVEYAFEKLHLKRIIATTEHENLASQAVMRKLGMHIVRNPSPEPPWLQVVGIIYHPRYPS
jgi:RimJ/RimL family protein N-acetyltransferase